MLFYAVVAWQDNFTGYVVDYGTWPDQQRAVFSLRDSRHTLAMETKNANLEGSIYAGLDALTLDLLSRDWQRDDGAVLRIERCLIDANWGESTDVVYQFCRQSIHAAVVLPSHGKFVGASSVSFAEYKKKPGDRVGHHWRIPTTFGRRQVRHVLIDTNYWKSFVHARLAVPMGDAGCLSLWGQRPDDHQLLADHLTAEYRVAVEGRGSGKVVDEWKQKPEKPDNHWFDCLVGCAVCAAMLGCVVTGMAGDTRQARKPVKLSTLQGN
jgi:phage terminase large subunit GpA-like protein